MHLKTKNVEVAMLAQDSTIESLKILHITKTKMWQLTHCPKNTPIKCHLFSGRNVLGWNCRAEMQHILQQIDETTSNSRTWKIATVWSDITKSLWQNKKNCAYSTMNLPYCTDCGMATDMMWSAKNLPHAKHMYGIDLTQLICKFGCHIMQPICHTVLSTEWQQTVCSHSIRHMNILSKWQQAHLMCTLVAVQCSWLLKLHWLPILATITVW